ncbi:MAG: hypothetical protein EBU82_10085 [Flavobacteriia bacterium]|nr:hypothetical protein [Flavobacteriia bacterium]
MTASAHKSNEEIIEEAKVAFKGQWGDVILAFILSAVINSLIGLGLFAILGVIQFIASFIFSYEIRGLLSLVLIPPFALIWLIFQGRVWIWQSNFVLRKSRGENPSFTDFNNLFLGFTTKDEIKSSLLDVNNVLKLLWPGFTLLLMVIAIDLGYLLLIVPGIIISFMLINLKLLPLFILCLLPCGIGLLWFGPYMSFVLAKFYDAHRINEVR